MTEPSASDRVPPPGADPVSVPDSAVRPRGRWVRIVEGSLSTVIAAVLAFGLGMLAFWGFFSHGGEAEAGHGHASAGPTGPAAADTKWTCSMHPQVLQDEPGLCPICGMDLIPVQASAGPDGPLELSPAALQAMQIETAPVERQYVKAVIELSGRVAYDETLLSTIPAWIPGRLDKLYVDYTGMAVRKGDHMVEIYSPELLSAQEELLQARRSVDALEPNASPMLRDTMQSTYRAAREKLILLGLTEAQVQGILDRGKPIDRLTLYAPTSGIVIERLASEGQYVKTGTPIYRIADLRKVWVKLDAYESDVLWLRLGQTVRFGVRSYPGEIFEGTVNFISPTVDPSSRTVRVRVTADNRDGRLKPDMVVAATVESTVAAGGKVLDPRLEGKWLCPMHPDQVSDGPASCDICGMPLETAESLGYAPARQGEAARPLVVPVSAVLWTGRQSLVYVQARNEETGRLQFYYQPVVLGPRAGAFYLVREGLEEGQHVAVRGNFKIDSERQIGNLLSMMNPPRQADAPPEAVPLVVARSQQPASFRQPLQKVFDAYFAARQALAGDDLAAARTAMAGAAAALAEVPAEPFRSEADRTWKANADALGAALQAARGAEDIETLRAAFWQASQQLMAVVRHFGEPGGRTVYWAHCPMAFNDRGANWLTLTEEIRNPYFGSQMLQCGLVQETIEPKDNGQ